MTEIISYALMFGPLLLILWLAGFADRQRRAGNVSGAQVFAVLSIGLLVALYLLLLFGGLVLWATGATLGSQPGALSGYAQAGVDPARIAEALPRAGLGMWLPSLAGLLLLLRPVRVLAAHGLDLDPDRTVHAVALSLPMLILVNMLFTIGFGLGNLAALAQFDSSQGQQLVSLPGLWFEEIVLALMGLIGVGWLSYRRFPDALARLGIVAPTPLQALGGIGLGIAMFAVAIGIELVAGLVGLSTPSDVQKLSNELLGPLAGSIPGILTVGLAAGLGEETLFRGALLPRFGLLLTTVLFALLHSTYGLSLSTLIVFLVGLALGVVRLRANTTTGMIVHAMFNISSGLVTFLGLLNNF